MAAKAVSRDESDEERVADEKDPALWRDFEELIASIQRNTARDATVQRNQKVTGALSGRVRELDVTISKQVGIFPVFIVIECKRYRRPVGMEKVEPFASKLDDVRAPEGIMIAAGGFDAGAKAVAKYRGITLLTTALLHSSTGPAATADQAWIRLYQHGWRLHWTECDSVQRPAKEFDYDLN